MVAHRLATKATEVAVVAFVILLHHVSGLVLAYSVGGWEATFLTLAFPIIGPPYWGFYVWNERGPSPLVLVALAGTIVVVIAMLWASRSARATRHAHVSAVPRDPPAAIRQTLTPHFEPLSDAEWERVTSHVRQQIARGELQLQWPEGVEPKGIHPDRIWAIAHEAVAPTHHVRELQRFEDIPLERRPRVYIPRNDVDLSDCWVAYLELHGGPRGIGPSEVVIVRGADGAVIYVGSANDEG